MRATCLAFLVAALLGAAAAALAQQHDSVAPGAVAPGPSAPADPGPAPEPGPEPAPGPLALYVVIDGVATGPHDEAAFKKLIRDGKLQARSYVWVEGMAEWAELRDAKALEDYLNKLYEIVDARALDFFVGGWTSDYSEVMIGGYGKTRWTSLMTFRADKTLDILDTAIGMRSDEAFRRDTHYTGTYEALTMDDGFLRIKFKGTFIRHETGVKKPDTEKSEFNMDFNVIDANSILYNADNLIYRRAMR